MITVRWLKSKHYSLDIWPQTDGAGRGKGGGCVRMFRWRAESLFRERLKVLCLGTNHVCNLIILRRIPIFVDLVWASFCHWDGYHGYFGHVFVSSQTVIVMSWSKAVMMPYKHNPNANFHYNVDKGWSAAEVRDNYCEGCNFCLKCDINMCLMKASMLRVDNLQFYIWTFYIFMSLLYSIYSFLKIDCITINKRMYTPVFPLSLYKKLNTKQPHVFLSYLQL